MGTVRGVAPRRSHARRARSFFSPLGCATALLAITMPVLAADSDDGIGSVVDAGHTTIIKKLTDRGEGVEQPRYNPGDGMMYMTSSDQNAVFQFDPRNDVLVKKYDVGIPCNPNGLAINPATNQALLGCSNEEQPMAVLWDVKAHGVITTFSQAGAGDMAFYYPKEDLYLFAASNFPPGAVLAIFGGSRSEERRVGKECRSRRWRSC